MGPLDTPPKQMGNVGQSESKILRGKELKNSSPQLDSCYDRFPVDGFGFLKKKLEEGIEIDWFLWDKIRGPGWLGRWKMKGSIIIARRLKVGFSKLTSVLASSQSIFGWIHFSFFFFFLIFISHHDFTTAAMLLLSLMISLPPPPPLTKSFVLFVILLMLWSVVISFDTNSSVRNQCSLDHQSDTST